MLQMGVENNIRPLTIELCGLGGHPIFPIGQLSLPVTLGDVLYKWTVQVDFAIVDDCKWYNGILGHPTIYAL